MEDKQNNNEMEFIQFQGDDGAFILDADQSLDDLIKEMKIKDSFTLDADQSFNDSVKEMMKEKNFFIPSLLESDNIMGTFETINHAMNVLHEVQDIADQLEDEEHLEWGDFDVRTSDLLGGPIENIQKFVKAGAYTIDKYNEIVSKGGILGGGKQVIVEELKKMKDIFTVKNDPPNPGGPGGNRSYDLSKGGRATNVQAAGANPIDITLNTDIKVRTYGDINLNADDGIMKYPLILTRQLLNFSHLYKQNIDPTTGGLNFSTDAILASYVNSTLNKINNIAQANVNYATQFTYQEIALWLSVLCESLNAYYGIYSIIQFEQDPGNRNDGMQDIRRSISAQDFNYLDIFCEDLKSSPMPDNLVKLFYFLNANYRFEDLPKSPIIKITGADIVQDDILNFDIPGKIQMLNSPEFQKINQKIFRTIPNWRVFPDRDLPMYGSETYHSRNFNTIFMNSGHVVRASDQTYRYLPTFDSAQTGYESIEQLYFSNTNDLDGLTTSLYCAYDVQVHPFDTSEKVDGWLTGLFHPKTFTQYHTNRAVFGGSGLVSLSGTEKHQIPFLHELSPGGFVQEKGLGVNAEQIYGLNFVSLRETCKELVDWMFNIGSIPTRKIGEYKPSKSGSRNRSRNRKSKNKGSKERNLME